MHIAHIACAYGTSCMQYIMHTLSHTYSAWGAGRNPFPYMLSEHPESCVCERVRELSSRQTTPLTLSTQNI